MSKFQRKGLPRPYDEYNTYQLKSEPIEALVKEYGQIRKRVLDAYRLAQKRMKADEPPAGYNFLKNVPPSALLKQGNVGKARRALILAAEAYQSPLSSISGRRALEARVIEALEARGVNFSNIKINGHRVDVTKDFKTIMDAVDAARTKLGNYRFDSGSEKRLIQAFANAAARGIALDRLLDTAPPKKRKDGSEGEASYNRLRRLIQDPDKVLTQKSWRKLS